MKRNLLVVLTSLLMGISSCTSPTSTTTEPNTASPTTENTTISEDKGSTLSNEETISEETSIEITSETTSTEESTIEDSQEVTSDNTDENPENSSVEEEEETLVSTYKFEGETFQYKNLKVFGTFEENLNGTLMLRSVGDAINDEFIVVPEEVNGKKVTKFANTNLFPIGQKIVISPTLNSIFGCASPYAKFLFAGNQKQWLESPLSLNDAGPYMSDLYLLNEDDEFTIVKDLVIEDGVETIRAGKFSRCNITSLKTPASLKSIGGIAFACCEKLSSIQFAEGLESIDSAAFSQCDHLLSIKLPSTLKKLGGLAFLCQNLFSLEVPAGLSLTEGSLTKGIGTYQYRVINYSEMDASFHFVKLTKDNDDTGAIFEQNGFYFGKCGNEITLLTYLGKEKELHLPTSITYNEETFTSYEIGPGAFQHDSYTELDPSLGMDYVTQLPLISKIYIPSCVTSLGHWALNNNINFSDGTHYMDEAYFDWDKETFLERIIQNKDDILWVYNPLKMYYKENNQYVLYQEEPTQV